MLQCKIHKNLSQHTATHLLTVILFPGQSSQMEEYTNKLHEWSYANNMQINKQKMKEMIITTSCTASVPLYPDIQRVETFKILSIVVSNNLKWNPHIAYITHKAHWRLHLLRQLKRATVPHHDTLHFYIAVIRPLSEYPVPVWHTGITADLSDQLETVQKWALHIIFGSSSFTHHSYEHLLPPKTNQLSSSASPS